jgi:hypothetical protein
MSYNLNSNFVPVEWYLAELWPLNLYFCSNFKLSGLFLDVLWYIDLIFGMWLYLDEKSGQLQIWTKNTSSRDITQPNIIRPERNSNLNWNFKLSVLFFDVLWYIDLLFDMWLYLDELQFKFGFCSGRMTFWLSYDPWTQEKVRTTSNLNKNTSSRVITHPNIIRPERNSNLKCKLSVLFFDVLWYIDLIFDMWLYLDELQFKFGFCSGRMTFWFKGHQEKVRTT